MTEQDIPITFVDNPHAPEMFVSDISGLVMTGANIAVTLESLRVDHKTSPGPGNRVVVGRIVLTIRAAQSLTLMLNDFLERQGLSPSQALKGAETAQ